MNPFGRSHGRAQCSYDGPHLAGILSSELGKERHDGHSEHLATVRGNSHCGKPDALGPWLL